ncbi:unnamed protein product [Onchocerca ochengi]|uniref:CRAL-TRIO domain-containing protein n=1 Tax=Onchocerca ochengi TaxID=42157 RepID=A0A182DYG3_ONCOC|nr:unnamed protein product [Onchocerca ochengi]
MPAKFQSPPPASIHECALIEQLRNKLTDELPDGIPDDLNTDLNLLRWIRGFDANFDKITKNFYTYVESRRAAGFDVSDLPEKFFDLPNIKRFLPYIAASRLNDRLWLDERNAFLFVERAWSQPKELILRREKKQSAAKGLVQFIVFFDAATLNLIDYLNPMSAQIKFWQMRSELWQNWYPEMVQKIYLVNPPRLISTLWKVVGIFLKKENLERIEIIGNHKDLQNDLPAWFIPREYAGEFVNDVQPYDETGVSIRRKIVPDDYIKSHDLCQSKGIDRPKSRRKEISAGAVFVESIILPDDHTKLLWNFTCSTDVEFTIYNKKKRFLYPRLHLFTLKVPEEGILENLTPNSEYFLEFRVTTSYFNARLDYYIYSTL